MSGTVSWPDGRQEPLALHESVEGGVTTYHYRSAGPAHEADAVEPETPRLASPRPPAFGCDAPSRKGALDTALEARFRQLYAAFMDEARRGVQT